MNNLSQFRLRANPDYELVQLDRLSGEEQQLLEGLDRDPECYGILRPRTAGLLSVKSVTCDAALLFLTLENPGFWPRYAQQSLGGRSEPMIAQLVLDGVLEMEVDGVMLAGPAASVHIYEEQTWAGQEGFVAGLSRRAMEYAQSLEISDALSLSSRLYHYNCLPASPQWRRLLHDQAAVERYLGVGDGAGTQMLERSWSRHKSDPGNPWLVWQANYIGSNNRTAEPVFKLYVSPAPDSARAGFQATSAALVQSRAFHFKAGADVYGLLRPDKFVAYFHAFADLQETADAIVRELSGCSAQGVPFTSELGGKGLVSWGIDPPTDRNTVSWLARESWRLRITNRLATALILANTCANQHGPPWRFAVERLRLEGIDTQTWTPTADLMWAHSA